MGALTGVQVSSPLVEEASLSASLNISSWIFPLTVAMCESIEHFFPSRALLSRWLPLLPTKSLAIHLSIDIVEVRGETVPSTCCHLNRAADSTFSADCWWSRRPADPPYAAHTHALRKHHLHQRPLRTIRQRTSRHQNLPDLFNQSRSPDCLHEELRCASFACSPSPSTSPSRVTGMADAVVEVLPLKPRCRFDLLC